MDLLEQNLDESKIKSIISIYNPNIFLSNYRLKLLEWLSKYYFTPIHNSNNLFFPKNLISKIKKNKINSEKIADFKYFYTHNIKLSKKQQKVFEQIKKSQNKKVLFYGLT
jgi:primosomal protein N'